MKIARIIEVSLIFLLCVAVIFAALNMQQRTEETEYDKFLLQLDEQKHNLIFYPTDAVILLQTALNTEGYECNVDGILGNETINAYNKWRANGFQNTKK